MRRFAAVAILFWCSVFGASVLAVNDPGRREPTPLPHRVARAAAAAPAADQKQAEVQARADGIRVEWDEKGGTPRSIRGKNLAARAAFSGGKGLKAAGRSHAEDAVAVLDNLGRFYRLTDAAKEFKARRTDADKLGLRHVRLEQTHRGLRVVGGDLIVHFDRQNRAYQVNGRHVAGIDVPVEARVAADAAVAIARKDLTAFSPGAVRLAAAPALVIYALEGDPCLAYEFEMVQPAVPARWRYWVDAVTGEILRRYDDVKRVGAPTADGAPATITGSVLAGEGGGGATVTGWFENATSLYYLHNTNDCWQVRNAAVAGWPDINTYAHRSASDWGTSDRAEISLASGFDRIQTYWRDRHGRNSFDNLGTMARANAHEGTAYVNAYYDGEDFHFGDGDNINASSLAVLDVAAHEFAHGVTEYSAALYYWDESGALNESFSDIFGACVEFFVQPDGRTAYPAAPPGTADWLMGEDCWLSSTALRDMRNPRNTATVGPDNEQPSRYKGEYWYTAPWDNGGVHKNSGVQNFFFYLLCEGGSGTNDGIAYNVTGIGIANAEQVAYRALTAYCTPGTDYKAARIAWLSAAEDLNHAWVDSVSAAWNACGVSPVTVTPDEIATFAGSEGGPFSPAARVFTVVNADPVPIGWTAAASQPWVTVTPGAGTAPASGSSDARVSVNAAAAALVEGHYTATVSFSNSADNAVVTRTVSLWIGAPDYFTELFGGGDNDLDNMALTFTPNGGASYYRVERAAAADFPSDPAGGMVLALTEDGAGKVVLSGGASVSLYGTNYTSFFVGANGYITFGTGDTAFVETFDAHFAAPRISALFDDLDPTAGGQVSWKQWPDRVAVTWQNVPEFSMANSNSFQIEMFFDGRIRIAWLGLAATDGLAGLSRGAGTPSNFVESDLSGYNLAPPPDDLRVLTFGNLIGNGLQAGPFAPAGKAYTLTNSGASAVSWAVATSAAWLSATPASGTLPAGQATDVTIGWGAAATALGPGVHNGEFSFSNTVTGVAHSRLAQLTVLERFGSIEVYDSIAPSNNLAMPFSNVVIGLTRTESVTITNTNPAYPVTISGISVCGPATFAPMGMDAFTGGVAGADARASMAAPSAVPCYGRMSDGTLVSFSTAAPGTMTTIGKSSGTFRGIDFLNGDFTKLYALEDNNNNINRLVTINTSNAAVTVVATCAPANDYMWRDMTASPDGTLYAVATCSVNNYDTAKLYKINPANGVPTFIGDIGCEPKIRAIAINARGKMYAMGSATPEGNILLSVDTATGAGTYIGPLGVETSGYWFEYQGMEFDEDNNVLYWVAQDFAEGGYPHLRVIDTATGKSTFVGEFALNGEPLKKYLLMAVANGGTGFQLGNVPALPLTLAAGQSVTFQVRFAPLTTTARTADVVIRSNDPGKPEVKVRATGAGIADYLQIGPTNALAASGHLHGPFAPTNIAYAVSNVGPVAIQWAATHTQSWVTVSPDSGTLAAGAVTSVTVSVNALANGLAIGDYTDTVTFSNVTSSFAGKQRSVSLHVYVMPEMQVAPASFAVTNDYGCSTTAVLTVSNAVGADSALDFRTSTRERRLGATAAAMAPLDAAATAAAGFRPPADRDFTTVAAGAAFAPGRLLVRFDPAASAVQRAAALRAAGGGTIEREYRIVPGLCAVTLPEGAMISAALQTFNGQAGILYAEPDYEGRACATMPNDPRFRELWGLNNTGQTGGAPDTDIDAPEAWDMQRGNANVVVALVDSGVDYSHEDLAANMWTNPGEIPGNFVDDDGNGYVDDVHGYDFWSDDGDPMEDVNPSYTHGTAMAGVIGAVGNNGKGLAGVCWNVRIMALKLTADFRTTVAIGISAIEYATLMKADVICYPWSMGASYSQAFKDAIDAIGAAGIPLIAPAGNANANADTTPDYPACYNSSNIISVMATDHNDVRMDVSNYGLTTIDLGAPGVSILECQPGNQYYSQPYKGTSLSAAYVAGAYALLLSANPSLPAPEAKAILLETVDPIAALTGKCVSGGRLNLARALTRVGAPWLSVSPESATGVAPGASVNCTVTFKAGSLDAGTYTGEVVVAGNDALHPRVTVPATMTVLPEGLSLAPGAVFGVSGVVGGPFSPAEQAYTVSNRTGSALNWTVNHTQAWMSVSAAGGTLAAGEAVVVTASVNAAALSLPRGQFRDTLTFSNATSGATQFRLARLDVLPAPPFRSVTFDTNPGWTCEGQWQFGKPQGKEGDPSSGHTGNNVYGYNLAGMYPRQMSSYYLTSTAFDCVGYTNVSLRFWRWLGVSAYGGATVEVSRDRVHWVVAWQYDTPDVWPYEIADTQWTQVQYDISSVADGQSSVYFRWRMGPQQDALWDYCGWNIDDLDLLGVLADRLVVRPSSNLVARGSQGGPFAPSNMLYVVSNFATNDSLAWTGAATSEWVTVTPSSGTIPASGSVTVTVAIAAAANGLPVGTYADTVTFSNCASGFTVSRGVALTVDPIPGEIAVSDSVAPTNDLLVPFGDVIAGLSRTESVTIANLDPIHPLVLTNLTVIRPPPRATSSTVPCYGIDLGSGRLVSFSSSDPGTLTDVGACGGAFYGLEFLNGDFTKLYALNAASEQLVTIATASGAQTVVGSCAPAAGHIWTGLAASPDGTLYAVSSDSSVSKLYRVDPATGAATFVGDADIDSASAIIIAIAMNAAGRMYGVDIMNDWLVEINPATGAGTVVGALGLGANYAQGLDFDEENDILYWASYSGNGPELRVLDTTTGASTLVGAFPADTEMEMAIASRPAFKVLDPPVLPRTLAPGESMRLDIRYAPTATQSNRSVLVIGSTDADEPKVEVELTGRGIPDPLRVSPTNGVTASGHRGGPFAPPMSVYTVSNAGPVAIQWSVNHMQSWIAVTPASGTLDPGARADVTVSIAAAANSLTNGAYTDSIVFSNETTTIACNRRTARLTVYTAASVQVSPESLTVTNRQGRTSKRVVTVGNAPGADAPLDIAVNVSEIGRGTGFGLGAEGMAEEPDPLVVAAAAAANFRPPAGRDFTKVQEGVQFAPGRLLVRFEAGASGAQRAASLQAAGGGTVAREYRIVPDLCVVTLPEGTAVEAALKTFNGQPGVLYAEPDYEVRALGTTPNDPRFGELWGMNNTGQSGGTPDADIDAPEAWDLHRGSRDIVVAVIDTGVDYNHEDLAANMWTNPGEIPGNGIDDDGNGYIDDVHGYDFVNFDGDPMDDHFHGTHCAGTIGAVGNNGIGVAGVCWNVRIMALKFLSSSGSGSTAAAISAVEYATRMKAKLTSNSWGGGGYNQALKDAIDAAGAAGIAFVAAAGNDGMNTDTTANYPSCFESSNITAVVAVDRNDARASFSNYGLTTTDLAAPGVSILSCQPGNLYQLLNGTSMATPHVAGAFALMMSANPLLTAQRVKAILMETVDPTLPGVCVSGGRLNLARALTKAGSTWLTVDPKAINSIPPGSTGNITVFFSAVGQAPGSYTGVVAITCNDPEKPAVNVPAVMVVPVTVACAISSPANGFAYESGDLVTIAATASSLNEGPVTVEFFCDGSPIGSDTNAPYSVQWVGRNGSHTLTAVATDAYGITNGSSAVSVTGTNIPAGSGSGFTVERWDGITGSAVSNLTSSPNYPANPSWVTNYAGSNTVRYIPNLDNYGTRLHGYFQAPKAGGYAFHVASDESSELWLSADTGTNNMWKVASVTGATTQSEWTKYATQTSTNIALAAGQICYIRALHKEGTGADHVQIGVTLPGGQVERPMSGARMYLWTLSAPTGLTATAVATNRIVLAWTDNATNETGYTIERSPDGSAWALVTVTAANATNHSDGGLAVDTLYYYRLAATNANGASAWAYASARTLTVYEQWRREHFTSGELGDLLVSGDNADPDHDGMNNIQEFYAGTDPRVTASVLAIKNAEAVAGKNWFIIEWQSASNRLYDIHRFTNLVNGVTNVIATDLPATPPMNVYTDKNADAQMLFYRIKVRPVE